MSLGVCVRGVFPAYICVTSQYFTVVLIYFLNEGILVCFFWTAFLSVASFPPYLCLLWNVPIAVYTDSRVWIGSVTLHCAFTSVYRPYHLWKQNTESLNVYRLKSPTHHSFSFLHTFSLFMTRSLHLNVVWYMYSGLLMYCWNVCSFDKVQFILWLMCVASNAADVDHRRVISVAPFVQLRCIPLPENTHRSFF